MQSSQMQLGSMQPLFPRPPQVLRGCIHAGKTRRCVVELHRAQLSLPDPSFLRRTSCPHPQRAAAASAGNASSDASSSDASTGGQLIVKLRKPVGVIFAQNKGGPVYVEEIMVGSNAEKCGVIQVGDVLSRCSAVVLKAGKEGQYEREGYGQRPYDNWETVAFDCEGKEFKTVMAALKSNNERWGINSVELGFRKPATAEEARLCSKAEAAA